MLFRSEKTKTEAVIFSINDGIILTDHSGKIQLFNRQAQRIFQLPDEDLLEKDFLSYIVSPELREEISKFIYGFDIVSLYNMFKEDRLSNKKYSNPYNRVPFQANFLQTCKRLILMNQALKHPINLTIDNEDTNQTLQQQIEIRF